MKLITWGAGLAVLLLVVLTLSFAAMFGTLPATPSSALAQGPTHAGDIPPNYLVLYVAAGEKYKIDWAILAAIGSIETNHGRLKAPGVTSGVNSYGCCAGPMQFDFDTWKAYGNGGDIYDPRDAIPAAARYLVAGGAPKDYHRAIFGYNHAEWYVAQVLAKAEEYRAAALSPTSPGQNQAGPLEGQAWLLRVPGTDQQCDARIVPNVVMILNRFHAELGDCYSTTGHESSGEHPLGLGVDLSVRPPATWDMMERLARWAGWRESCASTGCAGQTKTAFRFVGWNGYPGHGDPAHAGTNAHLHLSWNHGPGRPASSVQLVADG